MKKTYMYLISQSNGTLKCGISENVKQRFYSYNCHTGENLTIHFIGEGSRELEKNIQVLIEENFAVSSESGRRNEFSKLKNKSLIELLTKGIVNKFELINPFLENQNVLYEFVLDCFRNDITDCEKIRNKARRNSFLNKFGLSISTKDIESLVSQAKYEIRLKVNIPIKYNDRIIFRLYNNGLKPKDIAYELYLPKKYVSYVLGNKYLRCLGTTKAELLDIVNHNKYISKK